VCSLETSLTALALFAGSAAAHGGVIGYSWGGNWYTGFKAYNTATGQVTIQREWDTYNPITSTTDGTLSCNDGGSSLASGQLSATIAAGTKITANWNNPWPHTVGPVVVYMASCGGSSCTGFNSDSAQWFKIDQSGLLSGTVGNGNWGMGQLVAQNSSWTSTIPADLKPGAYLIRHELIAIHTSNAPQFYPECAQLVVTGSGTKTGSPTVAFPGGYAASNPYLNINIYATPTSTWTTYAIPGPTVFT